MVSCHSVACYPKEKILTVTNKAQAPKPPLPKAAYRVVNPVMKLLLHSPLHGLLSNNLMTLTFQGRKSGKRYTIPVGYLQRGDALYLFTHSGWWKNLQGGAPVTVRLRGQNRSGLAEPIQDNALMLDLVRQLTTAQGEAMSRRMGFLDAEGRPTVAPGTVFLRIRLQERPR